MEKSAVPTPDEIWRILKAVSQSQKETDQLLQKSKQETDRRIEENNRLLQKTKEETERQIKENRQLIRQIDSRWGNQWGILVEALAGGNLVQIFKKRGIDVKRIIANYKGRYQKEEREFDAIAINGKELVVVEAKSHFMMDKLEYFLENLKHFKKYCPEFSPWKVYGGIAYLRGDKELLYNAEKQGLFVVKVQGENAIMLNAKDFKPKIF